MCTCVRVCRCVWSFASLPFDRTIGFLPPVCRSGLLASRYIFHEVRQPLQVFSINLKTLKRSIISLAKATPHPEFGEIEHLVADMGDSCNSMATILNDVIDMQKAEEGKFTILPKPFLVSRLLQNAFRQNAATIRSAGIDFSFYIHESLIGQVVYGDYQRLLQVLNNLLSNARKFSKTRVTSKYAKTVYHSMLFTLDCCSSPVMHTILPTRLVPS